MAESLTISFANLAGDIYAQMQAQLGPNMANVIVMALCIGLFGAVTGIFWKMLSRRNIIDVDWKKIQGGLGKQLFERVKFALQYAIIFPLVTFLWFVVLAICLYFVSKTATISDMMLLSISLTAAIRMCAYIDREIAAEVAKVVPLGLLAVFLAEPTMFSAEIVEQRLSEMSTLFWDALPYLLMLIALEVLLRLLFLAKRIAWPVKEEK